MAFYGKLDGWVERGGQDVVARLTGASVEVQKSYPGATVSVYLPGTSTLASIFSTHLGTVKANPFTCDSKGYWFCFAAEGEYDVEFSGGGETWSRTRVYVSAVINVRKFGARGLGTGDTDELQDALDAAPDGGTVVLPNPPVAYGITDGLTVRDKSINILGESKNNTIVRALSAGSASEPMLLIFNSRYSSMSYMRFEAQNLFDVGIHLDSETGGFSTNQGKMQMVGVHKAVSKNLRIATSSATNQQCDMWTFDNCQFLGGQRNVSIENSNALRHLFLNCTMAWSEDGQRLPDYNIYIDSGSCNIYGGAYGNAQQYDIYQGIGSFLSIGSMYTESGKILYSDYHAAFNYATVLNDVQQNVNNLGQSVIVWLKKGPLTLNGGKFGGNVYLSHSQGVQAINCQFATGQDFIGPALHTLRRLPVPYRGVTVTSNTTITPTGEWFHVTNSGVAIVNIVVPGSDFIGGGAQWADYEGTIIVIPDGPFTWTNGGNIAVAGTAVTGRELRFTYDKTTAKWYPSYV